MQPDLTKSIEDSNNEIIDRLIEDGLLDNSPENKIRIKVRRPRLSSESDLNGIRDRITEIATEMRHDIEASLDERALELRLNHYRRQLIAESFVLTAAIANAEKTLTLEQTN